MEQFNVSVLVLARTQQDLDLSNLPITASGFWATSDLNPPNVQTAYVSLSRGRSNRLNYESINVW